MIASPSKVRQSRFWTPIGGQYWESIDIVFGVGLSGLILAGYFWTGHGFDLWLALVNGGGFFLFGLWMRRA